MRPAPRLEQARSIGRVDRPVVDVVVAVGCVTATAGRYVMPAFTTFLVFLLLVSGDPSEAEQRFWKRALET